MDALDIFPLHYEKGNESMLDKLRTKILVKRLQKSRKVSRKDQS